LLCTVTFTRITIRPSVCSGQHCFVFSEKYFFCTYLRCWGRIVSKGIQMFWDIMLCHSSSLSSSLRRMALKIGALQSVKTLGTSCPATQHRTQEGLNLQQHFCENLKSVVVWKELVVLFSIHCVSWKIVLNIPAHHAMQLNWYKGICMTLLRLSKPIVMYSVCWHDVSLYYSGSEFITQSVPNNCWIISQIWLWTLKRVMYHVQPCTFLMSKSQRINTEYTTC
jgi:hypothetical protein